MNSDFDVLAGAAATRIITWLDGRVDESRREWIAALAAEADEMSTGWEKLQWALSSVTLAWSFRRARSPQAVPAGGTALVSRQELPADLSLAFTTISLLAFVACFLVWVLPVFREFVTGMLGLPLDAFGVDVEAFGTFIAEAAGLAFLCGVWIAVRQPKQKRGAAFANVLRVVNPMLAVSALFLLSMVLSFAKVGIHSERRNPVNVGRRARTESVFYDLATAGTPGARFDALIGVARTEIATQFADQRTASRVGMDLLKSAPTFRARASYGDAIHHAHVLLGLVALRQKDVAGAKAHLLASCGGPGSPELHERGPNMALARDLLRRGETAVVVDYLERCQRLWVNRYRLAGWASAIQRGENPDFGR